MTRKKDRPKIPKPPFSFRKHIVPPAVGILMMAGVLGLLNAEWLLAQARYRFMKPAAITTAPALVMPAAPGQPAPQPDPTKPANITIPAIGVEAPIVMDEPSVAEWKVQLALRRGVLHYGATAVPGQINGNVVIVGHSSGQPWAPGDYKWIFTLLDKLKPGDKIYISYQGLPYAYEIKDSTVVPPEDVSVLNATGKPTLTLITCTPVGTSKNRLVVRAEQISPVPATQPTSQVSAKATPLADKPAELPR